MFQIPFSSNCAHIHIHGQATTPFRIPHRTPYTNTETNLLRPHGRVRADSVNSTYQSIRVQRLMQTTNNVSLKYKETSAKASLLSSIICKRFVIVLLQMLPYTHTHINQQNVLDAVATLFNACNSGALKLLVESRFVALHRASHCALRRRRICSIKRKVTRTSRCVGVGFMNITALVATNAD